MWTGVGAVPAQMWCARRRQVLHEVPDAILWLWMNPTTCERAMVKNVARWNLTDRVRCA